MPTERSCIVCGCTRYRACIGGCAWVEGVGDVDICSRCVFVDPYRQMAALLLINLRLLRELREAPGGLAERTRARAERLKKRSRRD